MTTRKPVALLSLIRQVGKVSARQNANVAVLGAEPEPHYAPMRTGRTRPSLVIFDKDGTLLCFHTMWIPWAEQTSSRIEKYSGLSLFQDIAQVLGLCLIEKKVKPGLLAEGTMNQINMEITEILTKNGIPPHEAQRLVDDSMRTASAQSVAPQRVKELHNTLALFTRLKQLGSKIAICTADNKMSTMQALKCMQVGHLVDAIVCGDDVNSMPKPHPHNALRICSHLAVHPSEAIMVGDTRVDVEMALSAGLGAAVGVLSGVGCRKHLQQADILIDHVGDLIHTFFDESYA